MCAVRKIGAEIKGGTVPLNKRRKTANSSGPSTTDVPIQNVRKKRRSRSKQRWMDAVAQSLLFQAGTLESHGPLNLKSPSRPLRVAHLMQYFAIGGLERMVERLSVGARAHGVESLVLGYLGDGPIRPALERHGIRTRLLEGGPGLRPGLVLELRSILVQERIDVLHTHHVGPFVYGAPAAMLARRPQIHTEHSHELYDTPRRRLIGAAMSPLATVVAVTPEVAEFRARFPGSCEVIPNGVPVPALRPEDRRTARERLGLAETQFVVGCAARLSPEKNHAGLLEAFAQLLQQIPECVLLCAGDGPLRDSLRANAEAHGLKERVRWLGGLENMDEFYVALDACVLNSSREGLPLSLLEAMSFNVPVVATEVGGVGELLQDVGVLVRPNASDELAGALAFLARDAKAAQTLGSAGRARVEERYGVESMVARYVELYQAVTSAPDPFAART